MKVYTCTKFTGYHQVGVAAVVVADLPELAAVKLNEELKRRGLKGDALTENMVLLEDPLYKADVVILCDGDY